MRPIRIAYKNEMKLTEARLRAPPRSMRPIRIAYKKWDETHGGALGGAPPCASATHETYSNRLQKWDKTHGGALGGAPPLAP